MGDLEKEMLIAEEWWATQTGSSYTDRNEVGGRNMEDKMQEGTCSHSKKPVPKYACMEETSFWYNQIKYRRILDGINKKGGTTVITRDWEGRLIVGRNSTCRDIGAMNLEAKRILQAAQLALRY